MDAEAEVETIRSGSGIRKAGKGAAMLAVNMAAVNTAGFEWLREILGTMF